MSTDSTDLPDLDAVQDTIDEAKRAAEKAPTVDAPDGPAGSNSTDPAGADQDRLHDTDDGPGEQTADAAEATLDEFSGGETTSDEGSTENGGGGQGAA
ncbi:hypothetical protein [Rhodococcoides kroppenstedtii]|uniref:hypothetical protein n=1 Tax=Rhodococcoides kroppenstedtii TaxID=293050 RepID=UPI001427A8C2|nr:hypothetical protein [Rhodococcus kroppenstedtii]NIL80677.1 hypothetical protein [Rhodococcus kroppenstedtii]